MYFVRMFFHQQSVWLDKELRKKHIALILSYWYISDCLLKTYHAVMSLVLSYDGDVRTWMGDCQSLFNVIQKKGLLQKCSISKVFVLSNALRNTYCHITLLLMHIIEEYDDVMSVVLCYNGNMTTLMSDCQALYTLKQKSDLS